MNTAALCLALGSQLVALPTSSFTLSWTHSVEKIVWEEDYLVAGAWLALIGARVRGSGAGMEPPPGAVREGNVWHYRPAQRWHQTVTLARSEFTPDYTICIAKRCELLHRYLPSGNEPTVMASCAAELLRGRTPVVATRLR